MSSAYLINPAVFLIDTVFGLYIYALLLRFLFQWVDADFYNPISQFLVKVTHPPLRLLRRIVPAVGRIDSASILLMLGLQLLAGYLVFLLQGVNAGFGALAAWAIGQLVEMFLNLYLFALIIRVLLSWVAADIYNPAVSLLVSLTEPLLRMSRRLLPPTGGIDLSPLIPLIAIQILKMLVLPPIQQLAVILN